MNFLKFENEAEALNAVEVLRDPAKGVHAKVADNPLFVELVINAPELEPEPVESYDDALERFRQHVEAIQPRSEYRTRAYVEGTEGKVFRADRYTEDGASRITIDRGRKYDKIVSNGSQISVHCFVRKEDGAVLKSASWKAPAKHARGTIYTDNPAEYGVQWTGARYL